MLFSIFAPLKIAFSIIYSIVKSITDKILINQRNSMMQLVPVLEIRHGKCVHTEPKNAFTNHVVSQDPMQIVGEWVSKGIQRVHYVDVDAIESGEPCNVDLLTKIKNIYPAVCIQVIGGIKDLDSAFIWIDAGADFLVLTSKAIRNRDLLGELCVEFPGKILVEMDSRRNENSLPEQLDSHLIEVAEQLEEEGVGGLVITEVPEKGHVNRRNLLRVNQFSKRVSLPIFANGGIENLEDLEVLLQNHSEKLTGIIIGKVVFNKDFCLNTAQQMLSEYQIAS